MEPSNHIDAHTCHEMMLEGGAGLSAGGGRCRSKGRGCGSGGRGCVSSTKHLQEEGDDGSNVEKTMHHCCHHKNRSTNHKPTIVYVNDGYGAPISPPLLLAVYIWNICKRSSFECDMEINIIDWTVFSYRLIAQRNQKHLYFVPRSKVTYAMQCRCSYCKSAIWADTNTHLIVKTTAQSVRTMLFII